MWLILGFNCNLNCDYCYEEHYRTDWKINQEIFNIEVYPEEPIIFFGGEPLLYMDHIKELVKGYGERDYSLITNGKLLDEDIVNYCNKNNIRVQISWDGENSSRKYDVFKDKKELIFRLNNKCIRSIISNKSYPFEFLSKLQEYNKEHIYLTGKHIKFSTTVVRPTSEYYIDNNKVYDDIKKCIDIALSTEDKKNIFYMYIQDYCLKLGSSCYSPEPIGCTMGITIDINGKMYECHSQQIPCGTIQDDPVYPHCDSSMCKDCIANFLCMGKCPYEHHHMCDTYRTIARAILERKQELLDHYDLNIQI